MTALLDMGMSESEVKTASLTAREKFAKKKAGREARGHQPHDSKYHTQDGVDLC